MPIDIRRFLHAVVAASTRRASMVQVNGYAVNAEVPCPPDIHGWTLSVDGDVATAMQLTGSDLRGMPVTEVTCVLLVCGPALAGQAG
jgi:DMSO/TMAO reductase YedYZ molybdopterin-dependent catalytic subunit